MNAVGTEHLTNGATIARDAPLRHAKQRKYCIRLKRAQADREDAWDLCQVVVHYGGVEIYDGCFAFASEERWLATLEVIRSRFGPKYFEPINPEEQSPWPVMAIGAPDS